MATMKRRIVYLSDTEWEVIGEVAKKHGQTISACIREQIGLLPADAWHETSGEKASREFGEVAVDTENAMREFDTALRDARR